MDLKNRTQLFLCYAMTEPAFFAPPDKETAGQLAEERFKLLTTGAECKISERTRIAKRINHYFEEEKTHEQ